MALRSTCLVTCPLGSSLESSKIHFVRQQPTEPSDCQVATWAHFRHFDTFQSNLSNVSWFVVFLMLPVVSLFLLILSSRVPPLSIYKYTNWRIRKIASMYMSPHKGQLRARCRVVTLDGRGWGLRSLDWGCCLMMWRSSMCVEECYCMEQGWMTISVLVGASRLNFWDWVINRWVWKYGLIWASVYIADFGFGYLDDT